MATAKAVFVGYNLCERKFRGEDNSVMPEAAVRKLWSEGKADVTQMVQRLITQCNWDGDALAEYYAERDRQ